MDGLPEMNVLARGEAVCLMERALRALSRVFYEGRLQEAWGMAPRLLPAFRRLADEEFGTRQYNEWKARFF